MIIFALTVLSLGVVGALAVLLWAVKGSIGHNTPEHGLPSRTIMRRYMLMGLYCNGDARWLLCGNHDTQRLFDEEIDGLGFQLKEWPWHWGREQFLADLCHNRKVLCDRDPEVDGDVQLIGPELAKMRRLLTEYEQACLVALGQTVAHALEATCRTLSRKETERWLDAERSLQPLVRFGQLELLVASQPAGARLRLGGAPRN